VGASLLQENDGELGLVLWRSLRTVCAWASVAPADRPLLFPDGARDQRMADLLAAAPPPALERPLLVLAELLGDPVRMGPDRVGIACLSVAAWAREAGRPATALEFTQAGALVCPGSPSYALAAARESRDSGEHEQSEALYHRAVALSRQVGDWDSYVRAHAGLGMLAKGRGAYPAARKAHLRALRAAERHRLGYLRAMMLHELFVVELDCGNAALAERYAGAAVEAYGRGHAMLRVLAFDVVLPNALGPLIALAAVIVANAILLEAALAFLGLGDPNAASWGAMIAEGRSVLRTAPHVIVAPGLAVMVTVLAVSLLGEGLSRALEVSE